MSFQGMAGLGMARRGRAWRGKARRGRARRGEAGQGMDTKRPDRPEGQPGHERTERIADDADTHPTRR